MNKKQLIVMWIGIITIVLMGLFPPWMIGEPKQYGSFVLYHFVFDSSGLGDRYFQLDDLYRNYKLRYLTYRIDFPRLFAQWFIVSVITGGLIVTFKDKKQKSEKWKKTESAKRNKKKEFKIHILVLSFLVGPIAFLCHSISHNDWPDYPCELLLYLLSLELVGFVAVWIIYWLVRWNATAFLDDKPKDEKDNK